MALALDIITVVVFIALISKGAAKGFLSALSELAGLIVSVAAAAVFCQPFGSFIYSHFLKDAVLRAAQSAAAAELAGVDSALAKLAGTYAGAKNAAVADAAASAGLLIGRVAAFAIILIVCLIVAGLIAHAFRGVNRLPVLGGLNRLAGAVLGAVTAALVMFVLSAAISALMPLSAAQKDHAVITASTIDSTYVFKYIYQADPLDKMLLK
jgi:uncharacterized membrane protein required for colicin V production